MKNIIAAAILGISLILSVFVYTERTRYEIVAHDKTAYAIDRISGKAWWLYPEGVELIKP